MSYNTPAQFKLFAYPSGSYNELDDSTIQFYLDGAYNLINSSLQRYHQLPLSTEDQSAIAFVKQGEVAIASYNLITFAGLRPNIDGAPDSILQQKAAEWLDPEHGYLTRFSKGYLRLQPTADNTPQKSEGRAKLYGSGTKIGNSKIG